MSLGKKKVNLKLHEISKSSQDHGFQSVLILKRRKEIDGSDAQRLDGQTTKNSKKEGEGSKKLEKLSERACITAVIIPWPVVKKKDNWM